MTDNTLKALSTSTNDLTVGNYIVLFGGRDLSGEFFTKSTKFDSNFTDLGVLYVDFEHGLDPDEVGLNSSDVLGIVDWKSARVDDTGIFVERVLNRRASYMGVLEELLKAGVIGTSSQCAPGKKSKNLSGEITSWPLMRDSLTVTPMEPRMISENVLASIKSLAEVFPSNKSLAEIAGLPIADQLTGMKAIESIQSLQDAERFLRDSGITRSKAVAFVSRIKSLGLSDSDGGAATRQIAGWLRQSMPK